MFTSVEQNRHVVSSMTYIYIYIYMRYYLILFMTFDMLYMTYYK